MLRLIPVPAFEDNYMWLVVDSTGAAVAIDPGDAKPLLDRLHRENWRLTAILLTHHHADHIGGVDDLLAHYSVPIYAPHDTRILTASHRVNAGERVHISSPAMDLTVIDVGGHTRSHIAYYGNDMLFCGDALFSVGCGRMFEGSAAQMLASLDRLASLAPQTLVCCGHEYTLSNCAYALTIEPHNPALLDRIDEARALRLNGKPTLPSTIGAELATNPFLRIDQESVVNWGVRVHDLALDAREARFAALRSGKDHYRTPSTW